MLFRSALAAIEIVAAKAGAALRLEGRDWQIDDTLKPSMAGTHQLRNANLAAQMLRHAGIANEAIRAGNATTRWPARLQKLNPGPLTGKKQIWIDGAHNPAAAEVVANELATHPRHVILGILANKDADGIIASLSSHALSLTFVDVPNHDSHAPASLAATWGGKAAGSLVDALGNLDDNILIVGSLYLAGEALRLNDELPD